MALYTDRPRLHQFLHFIRVFACCALCRRRVWLLTEELARHCGWDRTLQQLEPRLRCQQCGGRGYFNLVNSLALPPPTKEPQGGA
ncbi:hypothetical protein [Geminicoccus flavidas]|uniref:hypothetical protein n=1 Tax=Geminicoccus flavidas TaxID=2506407 RepID=UPI00135B37AD|nr:hypothetical protein [Geminicoccus flavidas]